MCQPDQYFSLLGCYLLESLCADPLHCLSMLAIVFVLQPTNRVGIQYSGTGNFTEAAVPSQDAADRRDTVQLVWAAASGDTVHCLGQQAVWAVLAPVHLWNNSLVLG
jgi:hypothetical protein